MHQELLAHHPPDVTPLWQFILKPASQFARTPIRIHMVCVIKANVHSHLNPS
jgi:hypothetical protein